MSRTKGEKNKVLVSGSIDPDVFEALQTHCRANPRQSRSRVISDALRRRLFPEHQEERERVLTANLDRLYWHQHNHADRVARDLRTVQEMLALFVRTFYIHIPEPPADAREAAAVRGEQRLNRFLQRLAEQVGPGKSALERMPEPAVVMFEDARTPQDGEEDANDQRD